MFKPMLSATLADPETLEYPVYVSPKLDGLRCLIRGGEAVSRNLKPFRNLHVQKMLKGLPDGLDGELIVGSPAEGHVLNRTQSGIMSVDGAPEFAFWVFDNFLTPGTWLERYVSNRTYLYPRSGTPHPAIREVDHHLVNSSSELLTFETEFLEAGYEGLMVRGIEGPYKHGRSTLSEGYLAKWKRFTDGEAFVTHIFEGVHNENQLTRSATGAAQRSHHQENKTPAGCVGTIVATACDTGVVMQISPGRMTHDMRRHYWLQQDQLIGKVIKYKAFEYGRKDSARFATFQDFRHPEDMPV
jgi:DNA ligase-1